MVVNWLFLKDCHLDPRPMKNKLRNGIALSLIPQIIIVQWLASHPDWIERFYSTGIYPWISQFFRSLFGWIPFSFGEIIYTLLIFLIIRYLIKNRKRIKSYPLVFLRDAVMVLAVFYFTFNIVWGLNYYRISLSETLGINDEVNTEKIYSLTAKLIDKTNGIQLQITGDRTEIVKIPYSRSEIFEKTINNYQQLNGELSFLKYYRPNLKKSMFSTMSSYLGIGGYLNPFTNEAHVNRKTPVFRFPVIVGHEIGHQIGYSAEDETNLIGYLVTAENEDIYFKYSATAYALSYCLNAVHAIDEKAAEQLYQGINEGVKKNYQELQDFNAAYENPLEPIFTSIFNTFLKANSQEDGVKSYSKVVNLMVGYHERFPL